MSLFGAAGGGRLFPRNSEADLAGKGTPHAGRPTPPGQSHGQAYAAVEPKDEAGRLKAQIGDANSAAAFGFRAEGGQTPADATGPGTPRPGAGVR
jgi:hypothetical protein